MCSVSGQAVPILRNPAWDGPLVIPVSLPQPIRTQPRHFTWLSAAICVLGAALFALKVHGWSEYGLPVSFVPSDEPVSVSVGPATLRLPESYIATARQRRMSRLEDARFEMLRLAVRWPVMSAADAPAGVIVPENGTIVIELESSPGRESLRARLDPFYRRLARGGELAGPDGLKILSLSARGEPAADLIAFDPTAQNGFIARCRSTPPAVSAICHRAFTGASGVEVRYSFEQALLSDWRQIDRAVAEKILEFRLR